MKSLRTQKKTCHRPKYASLKVMNLRNILDSILTHGGIKMNEEFFNRFKEPDCTEPPIVANDWNGDPIYEGDQYLDIDGVFVFEDDLNEYIKNVYGGVKTA